MKAPQQVIRLRGKVVLATMLAVAGTSLMASACGVSHSAAHGRAGTSATVASTKLCAAIPSLTTLTVRRSDALSQSHAGFTFPANATVRNAARAQAAARALCGLPRMPRGFISCPNDLGITYQLVFGADGTRYRPVTVGSTGCEVVTGLGSPRQVGGSQSFWGALAHAMFLRPSVHFRPGP